LLLDEPYTGLDQDASLILDELLIQAHTDGHTILMATHQLDRAARLSDRVVILVRGAIGYDALTAGMDAPLLAATYTDVTGMATAR
jgi:ABC-type multidrug transport system ATPase subunit